MLRFKYLNHTADVEFIAYGSNLATVIPNALSALFNTIAYSEKISRLPTKSIRVKMSITSASVEDLLWETLQRAISIGDARGIFFYNVLSPKAEAMNGKYHFTAVLLGKRAKPEMSKLEVKGVSKYNLSIRKSGKRIAADVVVDV
ncbi:MAG: archease [Candidatus Micrarchaeia archaeon]